MADLLTVGNTTVVPLPDASPDRTVPVQALSTDTLSVGDAAAAAQNSASAAQVVLGINPDGTVNIKNIIFLALAYYVYKKYLRGK